MRETVWALGTSNNSGKKWGGKSPAGLNWRAAHHVSLLTER